MQRIVRAALFYTRSLKNKAEVEKMVEEVEEESSCHLVTKQFPEDGKHVL